MSDVVLVGSDHCGLDDLFLDYGTGAERARLRLGAGWPGRWTGTWRTSDGEVACAVRQREDARAAPLRDRVRMMLDSFAEGLALPEAIEDTPPAPRRAGGSAAPWAAGDCLRAEPGPLLVLRSS